MINIIKHFGYKMNDIKKRYASFLLFASLMSFSPVGTCAGGSLDDNLDDITNSLMPDLDLSQQDKNDLFLGGVSIITAVTCITLIHSYLTNKNIQRNLFG